MAIKIIDGNLFGRKATAIGLVADDYNMCLQNKEEFKTKVFSTIPIYGIPYTKIKNGMDWESIHDATIVIELKRKNTINKSILMDLMKLLIIQNRQRNLDLMIVTEYSKGIKKLIKLADRELICKYHPKTKMCRLFVMNWKAKTQKDLIFDASQYFKYFVRKYNRVQKEVY
jgi:hypothetical protein